MTAAAYFFIGLLVGVLSTVSAGILFVILLGVHKRDELRRMEPWQDVIKNLPEW